MIIPKRNLGKTNILVFPIGFGGIPIQRVTKEETVQIISEALANKINFFDSARGYTCSEEYLGYALKENNTKRSSIYIATKSMSRTYDKMKADINISLNNFQTDYIDLYQIHNLTNQSDFEKVIQPLGCYNALLEAKQEGKINHIGITSHNIDFLNWLLDSEYYEMFDTIQFPYNFIETDAQKLFQKAHSKNIGTIAMKPLGGGVIDKSQPAIKFLLQDSNLSVLIPGMASIDEVRENTVFSDLSLNNEDNEYIEKTRNENKNTFCHRCGYCLPCTVGIDIPGLFTLQNYYEKYDLKEWALIRYENMSVKPDACINCKKCMTKCPYGIDIPNRLEQITKRFERK